MRLNLAQRILAVKMESSSGDIRDVSGEMSQTNCPLGVAEEEGSC